MTTTLTRHARKRMRQRGVGATRVHRAVRGRRQYQGGGVYRAEVERGGIIYAVVYKVVNGEKIILSTWRKRPKKRAAEAS